MSHEKSDEELMLDFRDGDPDAFGCLVDRHQEWAWSIAYRFFGDAAQAEDLVQEVFLKIFKAREDYKPTAQFRTYIHRILIRTCIDRDRKSKPIYTDELPPGNCESPDQLESLVDDEVSREIRKVLEQLSPRQRMTLILKYYHDYSYRKIGERMDCTEKAVESLLGRARESFRKKTPEWLWNRVVSDTTREEEK